MTQDQFRAQINRLRKHYGESTYSDELLMILWGEFGQMHELNFLKVITECIATRPKSKPPLRDELRQISANLGFTHAAKSAWRYFDVEDCMTCGGVGWYHIQGPQYHEATRACDDCPAGKNLQIGPANLVRDKHIPTGWAYKAPGRVKARRELHPQLRARFGTWDALDGAIREKRIALTDITKKITPRKIG